MILARLEPRVSTERESTERRAAPRRRLKLDIAGSTRSIADVEVVVHDLSVTGLLIEAAVDLQTGEGLRVELPGPGAVDAVVVWRSGNYFGCEFAKRISNAALSAASLRSAHQPQRRPQSRPQDDVGFTPARPASQSEKAHPADSLSPRRKLLVLLGLSLASWAFVALVVWLILALVWR